MLSILFVLAFSPVPSLDALGRAAEELSAPAFAPVPASWSPRLDAGSWLAGVGPSEGELAQPGEPLPPGLWLNAGDLPMYYSVGADTYVVDPGEYVGVGVFRPSFDKEPPTTPAPGWIKCRAGNYACCSNATPRRARCIKDATSPPPLCDIGGPGAEECSTGS